VVFHEGGSENSLKGISVENICNHEKLSWDCQLKFSELFRG
jgi:phage replication-related protein YjqB (UPF0714/DUF867 family)